MESWQPLSESELAVLVERQLADCTPEQQFGFANHRLPFYQVRLQRTYDLEPVFVIAELPSGLLYYDDVEEGFEVGRRDANGVLRDLGCHQLDLTHALARAGF